MKLNLCQIILISVFSICLIPINIFIGFEINQKYFHIPQKIETNKTSEHIVYITKTGIHFHSNSCVYTNDTIPTTLNNALQLGYTSCNHCEGLSNEKIIVIDKATTPEYNNYFLSLTISSSIVIIIIVLYIFICIKGWQ